jgi:hypothetical protein
VEGLLPSGNQRVKSTEEIIENRDELLIVLHLRSFQQFDESCRKAGQPFLLAVLHI